MPSELEEYRAMFYRVFRRDGFRCVYCRKDLLGSFDAFAGMHLDHLKPARSGGPDLESFNRVSACAICNSLKGSFDPLPGEPITLENYEEALGKSRDFVAGKRDGSIENSYYRDFHYWLKESGRAVDG